MEIGLYRAKYPFRKAIGFLKTRFRNTDPDKITLTILPIGIITAFFYYYAPLYPRLYLAGMLMIFLRMVAGTLDGLIAESQNRQTSRGAILNRLAPETADILLMLAILFAAPSYRTLGIFAALICWGISYTGLVGLVGIKKIQSIGPAGQTDRLVALLIASFLQYFSLHHQWHFDFIKLFLGWVIAGGLFTIYLRCQRILCDHG